MQETDYLNHHPLQQQKEAERMILNHPCVTKKPTIKFLLVIPDHRPIEGVWLDPSFGMFQVAGHEDKGFMRVRDLPEGSMITNQRVEDAEKYHNL